MPSARTRFINAILIIYINVISFALGLARVRRASAQPEPQEKTGALAVTVGCAVCVALVVGDDAA